MPHLRPIRYEEVCLNPTTAGGISRGIDSARWGYLKRTTTWKHGATIADKSAQRPGYLTDVFALERRVRIPQGHGLGLRAHGQAPKADQNDHYAAFAIQPKHVHVVRL